MYVLVVDRQVHYVGKTNSLQNRLQQHHCIERRQLRRLIRKTPNIALYLYPCKDTFMSYLEMFLIFTLRPPMNSVYPKPVATSVQRYEKAFKAMMEIKGLCLES